MMYFFLEDGDEALFAEFLVILWSNYQGSRSLANGTGNGSHFQLFSRFGAGNVQLLKCFEVVKISSLPNGQTLQFT
jgi:hypothetical protein